MDKSFEGLLVSVIVHAALVWLFLFAKLPGYLPIVNDTTEVTLIEKPMSQEKHKAMVTETELKPPKEIETPKDAADFLSQFTKRVKKQLRARADGPTHNAPTQPQVVAKQAKKVGGQSRQHELEPGVGLPQQQNTGQGLFAQQATQSTLSEYLPGIEAGAFNALNTDRDTYYIFYQRMNQQVYNRWVAMMRNYVEGLSPADLQRLSQHERVSQFEILLEPDGQFRHAALYQSSGERRLDQIPAEAFEAAAPFPHPPKGMVEPDGLIHLRYAFVLEFRPPSLGPARN